MTCASRRFCSFVLLFLLKACLASAVTNEASTFYFPFYFVSSDSRSLGMGNCFAAASDDVVSTATNPAGLALAVHSQARFEYQHSSFNPNNLSFAGISEVDPGGGSSFGYPSFLGVNLRRGNFGIGFARYEPIHTDGSISVTYRGGANPYERNWENGRQKLVVTDWTASVAAGSKHFSVGGGVIFSALTWNGASTDVNRDYFGGYSGFTTEVDDSDLSLGFSLGTILKTQNFSWGVIYTKNPRFQVREKVVHVNADGLPSDSQVLQNVVKIPNVFRTGVAVIPVRELVLSTDVALVQYTGLMDGFERLRLLDPAYTFFSKDEWEFHVGGEYAVSLNRSIGLVARAGFYRKPVSGLSYSYQSPDAQHQSYSWQQRDIEDHITLGTGMTFGSRFRWDLAFDVQKSPEILFSRYWTKTAIIFGAAITL